jgi:uncharacterized damage-inducible protein DinB
MSDTPEAFDRFRDARRETLDLVWDLSQEQMDFAASPRKWSVGQVLDHLVRVDEVFREEYDELLRRWRKKGRAVGLFRTLSEAGFSLPLVPDAFLPLFDVPTAMAGVLIPRQLRQAVFSNRAVPAQAPRRIKPRKGRRADDLRRELAAFENYLEGFFADNPDVEWEKLRYYNPLCGFTNLPGVMTFIASHEGRHQGQIREVLESKGFPAPG